MKPSLFSSLTSLTSLKSLIPLFIFFFGIFFAIALWWGNNSSADILMENTDSQCFSALETSNKKYFIDLSGNQNIDFFITDIVDQYPKKMDIVVLQKKNFLFYSFLGLKENSSVLHSVYGSWNSKTQKLTVADEIIFSIMVQENNQIIFTNNSDIAIPIDNSFLLLPSEDKGIVTFSEDLLLPGDSFIFTGEKRLPEYIFLLESLSYGYKAIIE